MSNLIITLKRVEKVKKNENDKGKIYNVVSYPLPLRKKEEEVRNLLRMHEGNIKNHKIRNNAK